MTRGFRIRVLLAGLVVAGLCLAVVPGWISSSIATQGAVASFTRVLDAANRGDLPALRRLCTDRYLADHQLKAAEEGGVVGLPRNIHKNFQAWRDGPDVLLCPTNRVGPVYRLVREDGAWKLDGLAGRLATDGSVLGPE